jgi:uncharacterized membrane protein
MSNPHHDPPPEPADPVWTFRGYKMKPGEFNTAMVHFYRGEISRSNVWRQRLDSTTNWAVVITGAVLTFAFSSVTNSHAVVLISFFLIGLFLFIEARRYRYYELWALRVRLMETDFFAAMLTPPFAPHREWATRLVDSLVTPEFPISLLEAIGRRLRRNFVWLFLILGLAWVVKLLLHPIPARTWHAFFTHAGVGLVPGELIVASVALFFAVLFLLAFLTVGLQDSPGEVLPRHEALNLSGGLFQTLADAASQVLPADLWHRQNLLTIIITDKAEAISQELLSTLHHGVTALEGKGMYSGAARSVLLCAVPATEVDALKRIVYSVDEQAFVVVNATHETLGAGFGSLQPRYKPGPKLRRSRQKTQVSARPPKDF